MQKIVLTLLSLSFLGLDVCPSLVEAVLQNHIQFVVSHLALFIWTNLWTIF